MLKHSRDKLLKNYHGEAIQMTVSICLFNINITVQRMHYAAIMHVKSWALHYRIMHLRLRLFPGTR